MTPKILTSLSLALAFTAGVQGQVSARAAQKEAPTVRIDCIVTERLGILYQRAYDFNSGVMLIATGGGIASEPFTNLDANGKAAVVRNWEKLSTDCKASLIPPDFKP